MASVTHRELSRPGARGHGRVERDAVGLKPRARHEVHGGERLLPLPRLRHAQQQRVVHHHVRHHLGPATHRLHTASNRSKASRATSQATPAASRRERADLVFEELGGSLIFLWRPPHLEKPLALVQSSCTAACGQGGHVLLALERQALLLHDLEHVQHLRVEGPGPTRRQEPSEAVRQGSVQTKRTGLPTRNSLAHGANRREETVMQGRAFGLSVSHLLRSK